MSTTTNENNQIINVPIEDIIPNRFQPRLNFDDSALNELAASIKEHGIIQPLILRRLQDKYEIIAGERRYKAAKIAGLMSVPAIVSLMNDKESAEVAIVENIQRKDLTSIEEAKSYKALLDKGYLTQEELAQKMGLSQSAISNKLRLLNLSEEVQKALIEGKISERHARSLLQLESEEEQNKWLNTIINERITVKELDKRLKNELNPKVEETDEIPIIASTPSIEDIKANATDIVTKPVVNEDVIPSASPITSNNGKVPNKFFNVLEDESVNMHITEEKSSEEPIKEEANIDVTEVSNVDETSKNEEIPSPIPVDSETPIENVQPDIDLSAPVVDVTKIEETPVNDNQNEEVVTPNIETPNDEEEIEMLDFLSPVEEPKAEEKNEEIIPPVENKTVDMTKASELIEKLEDDLRENNYRISILKENDIKEIRYVITIDKE